MEQKFTQQSKGQQKVPRPKIILTLLLLFFISIVNVSAQDNTVTGTVIGDDGEGMPGVIITTKDGSTGTQTDFDGSYSITVKDMNTAILVFNFAGYKTQEIPVKGQTKIDTKMAEDQEILEEVVAVGYQTKIKPRVTEAISSVNSKEMSLTVNPTLENAIQGRAAGVQVTQTSGAPGAPSSVKIRGVGSVNGAEPLYVIDGVPVTYDAINLLNPNDIQSVDILKDASATAIYGARGANGVVMITTRRGVAGKPRVSFESTFGVQQVWKKLPLLNSTNYVGLIRDEYINAGRPVPSAFDPASGNPYLNNNTDWQDQVFRTGIQQNYNLTMGGGDENATYSVSGGYFKQDGTVIGTSFERFSFRVNSDLKLKKWLKVGESVGITRVTDERNLPASTLLFNSTVMTPLLPVYDANGNYAQVDTTTLGGFNWPNIVAMNAANSWRELSYRTLGNVYAELEPIKGLKYRFSFGFDLINTKGLGLREVFNSGQAQAYQGDVFNRTATDIRSYRFMKLIDNLLYYDKTFGKNHDLGLLVGLSMQDFYRSDIAAENAFVPNQINTVGFGGYGRLTGAEDDWYALKGYLGRINYSYANKYLFTFNIRRDGSSKFGRENRYGTFPSFSIGWRPLQEDFVKNIGIMSLFSELKFRGSWGITGYQEALTSNRTFLILNDKVKYPFGNGLYQGLAPQGIANSFLRWEEVVQTNIGLDFALWKNRISGTFDYFIKESKGMLIEVPIPGASGFHGEGEDDRFKVWSNAGNLTNKGFEVSLTYRNDDRKFKYAVSGNFTKIKNIVTKLGDDDAPIFNGNAEGSLTVTQVGGPVGAFYGYDMVGIFQNQSEIDNAPIQNQKISNTSPGDVKFNEVLVDGKIDANDRIILGSTIPKFSYGINLSADYLGFDLRVFLQGVYGNKIYNAHRAVLESMGAGSPPNANQLSSVSERWTVDNPSNSMPRAVKGDPNWNVRPSQRWVENGSFLRLKSVQLGYNIPKSFLEKTGATESTARIYISLMNAFTITKYTGFDPELGSVNPMENGIDRGSYPQARTFLVGLQFGF